MSNSFNDYYKHAEYNFLLDVATKINKTQKHLECKVKRGISMSFLDFDGTDKCDLGLTGWVSIVGMDLNNIKLSIEYNSVYMGKGKIERTFRIGNLTVDYVASVILDLGDGKVIASDVPGQVAL